MSQPETNEVSLHDVLVYVQLKDGAWMTNAQIAAALGGRVAARTVRAATLKFVNAGIADLAEVFPAHRYRLAAKAEKRNAGYLRRLESAREVFGV